MRCAGFCGAHTAARFGCLVLLAVAPTAGGAQSDARATFIASVEAAQEARETARREALKEFRRTADALEAAGPRLGADARRRLEQGALADADRARDVAVEGAEIDWMRSIEGAMRDYQPAGEVWAAVKTAVAGLRTELGVYKAILEAADFAIDEAATEVNAVSRTAAGSARDLAALEARAISAEDEFKAADRAYEDAVRQRPQEVEAEGFGAERFAAFAQGLSARVAGDDAAAEAADRAGEDAFHDRLDAIARADAANEAAEAQYDAAVAAARAKRDAASAVFRDAAVAVRRASESTAAVTAERAEASRNRETSLAARRVAFADAVQSLRVYKAAELQALQRALTAAAVSVITELEEVSLAATPGEAVREIIDDSLDAYGAYRRGPLLDLQEALQGRYEDAIENMRAAEASLDAAEARNRATADKASAVLDRIQGDAYLPGVKAADRAFEDVLVEALSKGHESSGFGPEVPKGREMCQIAARRHHRAMQDAKTSRNRAAADALGSSLGGLAAQAAVNIVDFEVCELYNAQTTLLRIRSYKEARSAADAEFKAAVLAVEKTNTTELEDRVRDSHATAEAALHARDTFVGAGEHLVAFDELAKEWVKGLESDLQNRLLALALGGSRR